MNYYLQTEDLVRSKGFKIVSKDFERPWGGFLETLKIGGKLSPKILIVKPKSRLSWQYHQRRAEIWRVFRGECGIIRSDTNKENEMKIYKEGDQIKLKQGERHRLIGLDDHCLVAEIWQRRRYCQSSG